MRSVLLHSFHKASQQAVLLSENDVQSLRQQASQLQSSATPLHAIQSQQAGWLPTQRPGSGMDYAESRVYQPGDDPRAINWRLSARSQETFVKIFHQESRPEICLLLDQRRSMFFGTRSRLKAAQALRVAVVLMYAAVQHQIPLSSAVIKEQANWLDPSDVASLLHTANQPDLATRGAVEADLAGVISAIPQQVPVGSIVYILSDFSDLDDGTSLSALLENYHVQLVHIMDKAELALPAIGKMRLQSMHQSSLVMLDSNQKKERDYFAGFARQRADGFKEKVEEAGIAYSRLMTDVDALEHELFLPVGL